MKIGIIGGGAVGMLFSAYLSERHEVTLYTRTKDQAELINEKGISLITGNKTFNKKVGALVSENLRDNEDLLIVAVKQYDLGKLVEILKNSDSQLLFVQNGYSHVERLEDLPNSRIFLGVVEHGALKHDGNTVEHTGEGLTKVAAYRGSNDDFQLLFEGIDNFPFTGFKDYEQMLLEKLIVNAVINPLTGILGVRNGELLENPHYYILFKKYFKEISKILELENGSSYRKHVEQICLKTANNRSSLLKDLEDGKKTEIDAILGYVIGIAKEKGKKHRLAKAFYCMVKGKEYQGEDHF